MSETAVVILNWNGLVFLKKFLPLIHDFSVSDKTAIWMADNGSSDDSVKWVRENFPEVKISDLGKNYGFAGGYNQALKSIKADYYVLINSDIEVTKDWLSPLISHLDANPDVAACQPKILSFNERTSFEHAGAAGGFIDKLGFPFCRGRILNILEKDTGQYNDECNIFWSSGACMIIRKKVWEECGGFDEDFFAHMEEIDLCWRIHKAGYLIRYIPESTVYHVGGGTLPYTSPLKTYLNFRNSLYLLYKNLPSRGLGRSILLRLILDGFAAGFFLFKGQPSASFAIIKAHMAFYTHLPALRKKRSTGSVNNSVETGLILNKLLVFEFYIKRKKTYSSLVS
jgi:hypothetical protein